MAWHCHLPAVMCHSMYPEHQAPASCQTSPAVLGDQLQTSLAKGNSLLPQTSCPPTSHLRVTSDSPLFPLRQLRPHPGRCPKGEFLIPSSVTLS